MSSNTGKRRFEVVPRRFRGRSEILFFFMEELLLCCTYHNDSWIFTFKISNNFRKFICQKGSITINGISLTSNDVIDFDENNFLFQINIINHTFTKTNLQFLKIGNQVNIEIDMIARYVVNNGIFDN